MRILAKCEYFFFALSCDTVHRYANVTGKSQQYWIFSLLFKQNEDNKGTVVQYRVEMGKVIPDLPQGSKLIDWAFLIVIVSYGD